MRAWTRLWRRRRLPSRNLPSCKIWQREIFVAYDVLRTSLSGYAAASELVNAAQTNYDAALDYYKNGLGTMSDISVTQTGLLKAQYARAQARSDALSAAATMAFATGQLTNSSVP